MKLRIMPYALSLCVFLIGCNNCPNLETICSNSSIETHDYIESILGIKFLTNFREAVAQAKASQKPLLIAFCSHPLSGISATIEKAYRNQLYYTSNIQSKKIIKNEFIPLVLHIDDPSKINEVRHYELLNQIEFYFELYNPSFIINLCNPNLTLGQLNTKLLISLTGQNTIPAFVILAPNGQRLYSDSNSRINLNELQYNRSK